MGKEQERAHIMGEYLIRALELGGQKGFRPYTSTQENRLKKFPDDDYGPNIDARTLDKDVYVISNGEDNIFLVPTIMTNSRNTTPSMKFNKAYALVKNNTPGQMATMVFKDNKDFFRSAAEREHLRVILQNQFIKGKLGKANELHPDMINAIYLTLEENKIRKETGGQVTYFQPESAKLEQMIRTFDYSKVPFEQTQNWLKKNFNLREDLDRIYTHTADIEKPGGLRLYNNELIQINNKPIKVYFS